MPERVTIMAGPSRYPEAGGFAPASSERGVNLLNVIGHGTRAKIVEIIAEGSIAVFINGEEIKAFSTHGDTRRFYSKREGQGLGGKRYGTIESLEIVGSGKFNLVVT